MTLHNLNEVLKGGKGSGFHGHTGRPEKRGGSGGGGKRKSGINQEEIERQNALIRAKVAKRRERLHKRQLELMKEREEQTRIEQSGTKPNLSFSKVTDAVRKSTEDQTSLDVEKHIKGSLATIKSPDFNTTLKLSKNADISMTVARDYITSWNRGDEAIRHAVAISVQQEFGIGLSPYEEQNKSKWTTEAQNKGKLTLELSSDYKKAARATYIETQKQLKKLGIKKVVAYRGLNTDIGIDKGDVTNWHGNSLDSWTADKKIAKEFGSIVMKSSIPVNRIFSMSSSGPGTSVESEIIVFGNGPNDEVFIDEKL